MPLPDTYSELYPGRFLKADMLKGRRVTLTIKNIDVEELVGETNKAEPKVVISFKERPLEYVCPKTNGFCMKRMWGTNPHDWIGKRLTIFPTTTKFGRETVDCIRIFGSPDIPEDMPITVPQGRKKALEMVMHKTEVKSNGHAPVPAAEPPATQKRTPPARALEIFPLLGWGPTVCDKWLEANANLSDAELVSKLESELDK
jgi:hypothetical protein